MFQSNILSGVYIDDYILIHEPMFEIISNIKVQPLSN